jgi:hypothetical protein
MNLTCCNIFKMSMFLRMLGVASLMRPGGIANLYYPDALPTHLSGWHCAAVDRQVVSLEKAWSGPCTRARHLRFGIPLRSTQPDSDEWRPGGAEGPSAG